MYCRARKCRFGAYWCLLVIYRTSGIVRVFKKNKTQLYFNQNVPYYKKVELLLRKTSNSLIAMKEKYRRIKDKYIKNTEKR